jgi:hypothetical protein
MWALNLFPYDLEEQSDDCVVKTLPCKCNCQSA